MGAFFMTARAFHAPGAGAREDGCNRSAAPRFIYGPYRATMPALGSSQECDLAIVGAGAAGLMAAASAGRAAPELRVVCVDGARKPGAKILVSGGGRCNVTNERVTPADFAGASAASLRKILARFPVERTVAFFAEQGVRLVREERGKLFPEGNRAREVLAALLRAAEAAGVELRPAFRVATSVRGNDGFVLEGPAGRLAARRLILATGGRSLPRSGSDGHGYRLAASLGVASVEPVVPALVPLVVSRGEFPTQLAGIATEARLSLLSASGKTLTSVEGSLLCTHFGISGPAALDISRHWILARAADKDAALRVNWLPGEDRETLDGKLLALGAKTVAGFLRARLPERLARTLADHAGVDPATRGHDLSRHQRRSLLEAVLECRLDVVGDRGWNHAEVTAGGVPLSALRAATLEARDCPGLHLCGEICDVDGRLGGFNFQWAWASGFVAGSGAAGLLGAALR
jgi:predicted Rossmann fold flavoprotein